MPPTPKRNAAVILYDVNTTPEFEVEAKKCLLNICASKWFLDSKDTTKLILLNTQQTQNKLHDEFGKAGNIYEATDEIFYDPKLILEALDGVEKGQGDWCSGLTVAHEYLKTECADQKGVMNVQLLFISDFSVQTHVKQKRISFLIECLNELNVFLYILGPKVRIPFVLASFDDIRRWAKNVEFVEENANFVYVKQIVEKVNKSLVCDLHLGEHLFRAYIYGWGLQPWKVPLSIGDNLSMGATTIRFLDKVKPPKIVAEGKRSGFTWHLSEDVLTEVPYDNVIGGIYVHETFVPLPSDVEQSFKYTGPRSFKILAFTDRANISEVYMQGYGSSLVESDNSQAFKLMVSVLKKQNKCAIGYRMYMQNCKPKLVAFLPREEDDRLVLVELPYGNKVKTEFVECDVNDAPVVDKTNPTVAAMYDFLGKLDVTNPENFDENKSVKFPLAANLRLPYQVGIITQRCLQKYIDDTIDFDQDKVELPKLLDDTPYHKFVPVHEPPKEAKK